MNASTLGFIAFELVLLFAIIFHSIQNHRILQAPRFLASGPIQFIIITRTMPRSSPLLSRGTLVALLVAGTLFMENLDGTVILTALPQIAHSFNVHTVDMNIGVSAYLLTLAVLIPASGWMCDRFSVRSVFTSAIIIFTLASILCGLCHNLTEFTLARILQGIGGAMMVPVGRLAVLRTVPKHDLLNALATITWPGLAAPLLGPPLGGFIATYFTWHWIFFLNIPLGVVALFAAFRLIPKEQGHAAKPFDTVGFLLAGSACFSLIYVLEMISREPFEPRTTTIVFIVTAAIWAATIFHSRRHAHPLIDLRALSIRSYSLAVWAGSCWRTALFALPFLLPLLFQIGFGLNAFRSGLLLLAVFAGNLGMKPLTTPVLRRYTFRTTLIVNGAVNAILILACALLHPTTPVVVILALLFASGLSRSMQLTALTALGYSEVPEPWMTGANTLFNVMWQMSSALGIALGALALRAASLIAPDAASGVIPLSHFRIAFLIVGVVAILPILEALRLDPAAGDNVRQPKANAV